MPAFEKAIASRVAQLYLVVSVNKTFGVIAAPSTGLKTSGSRAMLDSKGAEQFTTCAFSLFILKVPKKRDRIEPGLSSTARKVQQPKPLFGEIHG